MFNQRRYRPMGVADLFDEAFDLYKSNLSLLLGAAAIVYIPLHAMMIAYFSPSLDDMTRSLGGSGFDFDTIVAIFTRYFTLLLTVAPIDALFFAILSGSLVTIAANRYLDRPIGILQSYGIAVRRFIPLLLSEIVPAIYILLGSLFCGLPGVVLFCLYICIPQVVLLEPRQSPLRAKKRAWQLTRENFWRILGCLILLYMIVAALSAAVQSALYLIINFIPVDSLPFLSVLAAHQQLANEIAQAFAAFVVYPFGFTLLTVLYYDFRIRQEGYNMVILADHLGFSPVGSSPTGALPQARLEIPRKQRRVAR